MHAFDGSATTNLKILVIFHSPKISIRSVKLIKSKYFTRLSTRNAFTVQVEIPGIQRKQTIYAFVSCLSLILNILLRNNGRIGPGLLIVHQTFQFGLIFRSRQTFERRECFNFWSQLANGGEMKEQRISLLL